MLERLLAGLMLLASAVGCGCRGEPASSAERDRSLQTARRWRSDSPEVGSRKSEAGGRKSPLATPHSPLTTHDSPLTAAEAGQDLEEIHSDPMNRVTTSLKPAGAANERGTGDESTQPKPDEGPRIIKSNTGDSDKWPSYDMPLVIEIEVPEFPERIK